MWCAHMFPLTDLLIASWNLFKSDLLDSFIYKENMRNRRESARDA